MDTKDKDKFSTHDCYEKYRIRKRSYDSSSLPYNDGRKTKVEKKLYMDIVHTYNMTWFRHFLQTKGVVYFPLGGFAKKVLYKNRSNFLRHKVGEDRFGIFWYNRISSRSWLLVSIKKIRGTGLRIYVMEKTFRKYNNLDYIPKFEDEIRDKKKKRMLFKKI